MPDWFRKQAKPPKGAWNCEVQWRLSCKNCIISFVGIEENKQEGDEILLTIIYYAPNGLVDTL